MKNILITGASGGIGQAIARQLAGPGNRLFLGGFRAAGELREFCAGTENCIPLIYDISDDREVGRIFEEISGWCDGPDVLINNAGISYVGLLQDMTIEDWNRVITTNLTSVFSCCRRAIPAMVARKQGRILNISSIWGNRGASCEAAYSASKGGVNALTQALAKELAPSGIRVNAIACGVIDTKMNACFSGEERAALAEEIPAGRFGRPEEVAALVETLINGHDYLTGQIITLDGGFL